MRIIFTGSGEFGIPTLQRVMQLGHKVVAVYTQPDRPAGRGRKLTPTPVAQFAGKNSLPVFRTEHLSYEQLPEADLMIVIAFGQKISPAAADHPKLGSMNLHASRLPKFRGAAPINWAILSGEKITGNSVIRLAQKMDAGDILGQSSVTIGEVETAGELHDRLAVDGAELVAKVIADFEAGRVLVKPQNEALATRAPKLSRDISKIDWNQSAGEIAAKIRGLYPWPGCRVAITDAAGEEKARLTLVRAIVAPGEGPRWHAGEISTSGKVSIGNGDEEIEILEVQPESKTPMALNDYRRGNLWAPGMRLVSL
jgi:methionyl-tRNA formyltransferase